MAGMSIHIIYRCLGFPFITAFLLLWPGFDRPNFRLVLFLAIAVGILIRYILNKKMYLLDFALEDDGIHIQYMTAFLTTRSLHLNLQDLEQLTVIRDRIRYEYAGILHIKIHGQRYSFPIITNQLFKSTEKLIGNASSILAKEA